MITQYREISGASQTETWVPLMNSNKGIGLRAAEGYSKFDEISNDPNMPVHARTEIADLAPPVEPSRSIDYNTVLKFFYFTVNQAGCPFSQRIRCFSER